MAVWQFEMAVVDGNPDAMDACDGQGHRRLSLVTVAEKFSSLLPELTRGVESIEWGAYDGDSVGVWGEAGEMVECRIRLDLRRPNRRFLERVVDAVASLDCVFLTEDGQVIESKYDDVVSVILASDAATFVQDPHRFIERIEQGSVDFDTDR